jgi:hypothetical protein
VGGIEAYMVLFFEMRVLLQVEEFILFAVLVCQHYLVKTAVFILFISLSMFIE